MDTFSWYSRAILVLFSWYSRAFYGQMDTFFVEFSCFFGAVRAILVLYSCYSRGFLHCFRVVLVVGFSWFSWVFFRDFRVLSWFSWGSTRMARNRENSTRTAREIARWELRNIAREKEKKMSCNVAQFQKKQGKISWFLVTRCASVFTRNHDCAMLRNSILVISRDSRATSKNNSRIKHEISCHSRDSRATSKIIHESITRSRAILVILVLRQKIIHESITRSRAILVILVQFSWFEHEPRTRSRGISRDFRATWNEISWYSRGVFAFFAQLYPKTVSILAQFCAMSRNEFSCNVAQLPKHLAQCCAKVTSSCHESRECRDTSWDRKDLSWPFVGI